MATLTRPTIAHSMLACASDAGLGSKLLDGRLHLNVADAMRMPYGWVYLLLRRGKIESLVTIMYTIIHLYVTKTNFLVSDWQAAAWLEAQPSREPL